VALITLPPRLESARVVADSVGPDGQRLTTMEVTFWRAVLAEFNTHRVFTRNSASSRAIPVAKILKRVRENPFLPIWWGANEAGMSASAELPSHLVDECIAVWLEARNDAVKHAERLMEIGLHKQVANRLLEPFMYHTVLVTATDWSNFYALRAHKDAQPEIQSPARLMREAMDASTPQYVDYTSWHLPLVTGVDLEKLQAEGFSDDDICLISAGRCARVSYLTHDGVRDPKADITLANRLLASGHMSPLEHVAQPLTDPARRVGNFAGWGQYRKLIPNESDFGQARLIA